MDEVKIGDVIQVSPDLNVVFGSTFAIVDEVKAWGVVAYVWSLNPGAVPGQAYLRIPTSMFVRVGKAAWLPSEE